MLRRLDLKAPWRSLGNDFWPDDLPLGRRTVIYGHNGSGKSTLAELLLSLADGACVTDVVWEDENKHRTTVEKGGRGPSPAMAVFTRKWVESNLSAFLDGERASAIVTLGKEAIEAKEEEGRLEREIGEQREKESNALARRRVAEAEAEKIARDVQDRIVTELREFDHDYFTKHRFTVAKVKEELRGFRGQVPDESAHADALRCLREGAPSPVATIAAPPEGVATRLVGLAGLLEETPTRAAIRELEENSRAQAWVEQGIALHEGRDRCFFCAGDIQGARWEELDRHFDESWFKIRSRAIALRQAVNAEMEALLAWRDRLPAAEGLVSSLRQAYTEALVCAKSEVDSRVAVLAEIEKVLELKAGDPGVTPDAPDWAVLSVPPEISALCVAVREHNETAKRHREIVEAQEKTVFDHLVGSQCEGFRNTEALVASLDKEAQAASEAAKRAERRLEEVRRERFTTKQMADTLTEDLARVYGKGHLSVTVTPDGKSYACRRGQGPATNLSEGERATLSLLYFLRKLEDERVSGHDPSKRIVVIDDPSSSLDREALFATHQWLVDTLQGFGQYIVLTHDFGLLRLFIKSQNNRWGESVKKIRAGDPGETRFPKVSFLETYAEAVDGERRSRVDKLPDFLRNNTSEYAYLFSMVMAGIENPKDYSRLFLLPNAARRVLEIFASYKAPDRANFLQQLEAIVQTQPGQPFRDVYDFCNRFSHGEGAECTDVLDARTVHAQIRRCMEFLRAVDQDHFIRMCRASDVSPSVLP